MENPTGRESSKSAGKPRRDPARKPLDKGEELLREQSKTETEERPYLDTEGGE
jgi:hypothetical protein